MRTVFADSHYWLAAANPRDSWRRAALTAKKSLGRYARREDKEHSFTDCGSVNTMDAEGIRDVLTHDHHFEQEGYRVLIKERVA